MLCCHGSTRDCTLRYAPWCDVEELLYERCAYKKSLQLRPRTSVVKLRALEQGWVLVGLQCFAGGVRQDLQTLGPMTEPS